MRISGLLAALVLVWGCKGDEPVTFVDLDNDGYTDDVDCNDADASVFPNATETCDGIDQNCNGEIDDDLRVTYYRDGDSDGFGDPASATEECARPAGFVTEGDDCDDTRNDVFPGAGEQCDAIDHDCDGSNTEGAPGNTTFYLDSDNDGFGDRLVIQRACEAPSGYVANDDPAQNNMGYDCDDDNAAVNPAASELCATAYDDDCDGTANIYSPPALPPVDAVDFPVDADGDGYGHETVTWPACQAGVAVDQNNDGLTDFVTVAVGLDTDCNDSNDDVNPNAPEICDGIDNDCDPTTDEDTTAIDVLTWYQDADGDGAGLPSSTVTACTQPQGYAPSTAGIDCDDTNNLVSPIAVEACGDSIDNNCDGLTDDPTSFDAVEYFIDVDEDGFGAPNTLSVYRCTPPMGYAPNDYDCNDTDPNVGAPPPQFLDNDGDGYGDPLVSDIDCDPLPGYVGNDLDCDDDELNINPDTPWYLDDDGDGYGLDGTSITQCLQPTGYAAAPGDCDDANDTTNPGALDFCDGIDNNCNGDFDEDCTVEHCGTISADETWANGFIHLITCDVRVQGAGSPVLTIEDGADVRFRTGTQLRIGTTTNNPGTLQAFGGSGGIRFRSEFPSAPLPWDGIEIGPGADPVNPSILENVTIEDASGSALTLKAVPAMLDAVTIDGTNGTGISLEGASTLEMTNSTIQNGTGRGISGQNASRLGFFQGNTITGNVGEPLVISVASIGELDNLNTYAGNTSPYIGLLGGTLGSDATLALVDADYRVDGDILVQGGGAPELTVADGVVVAFSAATGITVGSGGAGSLVVDGSSLGVDFHGTTAVEGHWDGVYLAAMSGDSSITGLTIAHGGNNGFGNLRIQGSTTVPEDERVLVTLDAVDSSLSSESGLDARHAKLVVTNSTFTDNLEHGAEVLNVTFSESDLTGNLFADNADSGVRISPHLVELLDGNTYTGNGLPIEITAGTVPDNATWRPLSEDFYLTGVVSVQDVDAPILTLEAGTTLYHEDAGQLTVAISNQGSLVTNGTAVAPVQFLPITDFLGLPSSRGSYLGLEIGANQRESSLAYTEIKYAGFIGSRGSLYITGSHPNPIELDHVTIQYSGGHGLVAGNGAELYVHDSNFLDNDDIGVRFVDDRTLLDRGPGAYSFEFNTIDGSGLEPLSLFATDVGRVSQMNFMSPTNNNLASADPVRIIVTGGTLLRNAEWFDHGIPYWLISDIDVGGPAKPVWRLNQGVRIEIEPDQNIEILVGRGDQPAGMIATGTPTAPVVFTSAAPFPTRGDWGMLELGEECDAELDLCRLDNVLLEYGGASPDEATLSVVFREYVLGDTKPVIVQNTTVRESGANGIMFAFYEGIQVPTPEPGIIVPLMCEDLNNDNLCDTGNLIGSSDSPDFTFGYDNCFNSGSNTFGLSNFVCGSNDANVLGRNFTNPYLPRSCASVGRSDGPITCP
ncbi:MAG: MopE-related protein [Myxococcota bacterium]